MRQYSWVCVWSVWRSSSSVATVQALRALQRRLQRHHRRASRPRINPRLEPKRIPRARWRPEERGIQQARDACEAELNDSGHSMSGPLRSARVSPLFASGRVFNLRSEVVGDFNGFPTTRGIHRNARNVGVLSQSITVLTWRNHRVAEFRVGCDRHLRRVTTATEVLFLFSSSQGEILWSTLRDEGSH